MAIKHSHNYIYISKSDLQSYYLVQKLTLREIAEIYNCSINAIYTHMIEYDIPRRSLGECRKGISMKHSGQFKKGFEPWNKNISGYSTSKKGMKMPKDVCKKMSKSSYIKGKHIEDIHKSDCQCAVCKAKRGELIGDKHPRWKGGFTPEKKRYYSRKHNAKRKGYGDIFLFDNPFDESIPVVGHHISDGFMVYLPESLHINYLHGSKKQLHRDELKPYVESIYNFTYIVEGD